MNFPARIWNEWAARVRRAWPIGGAHARAMSSAEGVALAGDGGDGGWAHPWRITAEFFEDAAAREGEPPGEWRAAIRPGFVNGRDVFLAMPAGWSERGAPAADIALSDDPAPWLVLDGWRNPLAPGAISATLDGDIVAAAGEGYPEFFEQLGVKLPAAGGDITRSEALEGRADAFRTREIRALDVVLRQPRIGTKLDLNVLDPLSTGQTYTIGTNFVSGYFQATGGRASIVTTSKYRSPTDDFPALPLGILLRGEDRQWDELKIATVWIVSPPDVGTEAVPDGTWTPYAQHEVFWNLGWATKLVPPGAPDDPLRISTGLGLGLADYLGNAQLTFTNDQFAEMTALLNQGDTRGTFWSP